MRKDQQIQVNELLLQREELLLRIHGLEAEVTRILGGPYPFTPPDLPSTRRSKRKAGAVRSPAVHAAGASVSTASENLRRLEPGETAYRVTYRQFSQVRVEEHADFDALRTLLACQGVQLEVQKIETLRADGSVQLR